ncbi:MULTISPECIES: hypothetical protein [Chryseobacterium]|nr:MULTISPECIES: hypothetical protein [Chryseobacterium]MPS63960.1 hypothetical protein [Chryseobacterium sp.]
MKKRILLLITLCMVSFAFAQETPETKTTPAPAPATIINVESLPHYVELKKRINLTGVVMTADKEPEFPGGMALFRRKFAENMEVIYAKGKKIDTRVYFIVEKNGYINNIAAISNNKDHAKAAEAALKKMLVRWKPALVADKPVRFLYSFPLSLQKY